MLERQSAPRTFHSSRFKRIKYSTLLREIFKRVKDPLEAQKLADRIRCHGVPGDWSVGIYIEDQGVVYPTVYQKCRDYNEGFFLLLCWLHQRNFLPFSS